MEGDATVQEGVSVPERVNKGQLYVHKRRRISIEPGSSQNVQDMSSHTLDEIVSRFEQIKKF